MFFDDAGTHRDGRHRNFCTERVVGVADLAMQFVGDRLHGPEVDFSGRAGIIGRAVKHGDVLCTCGLQFRVGLAHAVHVGHPGRKDHRSAAASYMAQEREVGDVTRSKLDQGHAQTQQEVDILRIVAGRQEYDADAVAISLDVGELRIAEFQLFQHLKLRLSAAQVAPLVISHVRVFRHDAFRDPGLELDGVGARRLGCIAELQGEVRATVVVDAGFGDNESLIHGSP